MADSARLAEEPSRSARAPGFRIAILAALFFLLFISSFVSLRTSGARAAQNSAQLQVDTLFRTRALYSARSLPATEIAGNQRDIERRSRALIRDLRRLADSAPSPRAFRRLAITQYVLGDPGWKESLLRLRTVPATGQTFFTESELAMWGTVLDGKPTTAEVPELQDRIRKLNLGWYQHLALESLYRRAGLNREADRESDAANSSTSRLLMVLNIGVLAGITGLFLAARQVAASIRKPKRIISSNLPPTKATGVTSLPGLSRPQTDVLYNAFVIYLATFAFLRLVVGRIPGLATGRLLAGVGAEAAVAIQLALSSAAIVPTVAWLVVRGRKVGLRAEHIGLKSRGLAQDFVWGAAGYAVALPLLYAASVVSSWLFGGVQSPPHPVLAEVVAAHSAIYLAMMFAQVAILPPLSEELMFRGVFFRALMGRMSGPAAVVLTSALFAILHPQLPLGFLGIFVLGIIFNVLYLRRGSLVPAIVAHALNNGVIFAFFVLLTSD